MVKYLRVKKSMESNLFLSNNVLIYLFGTTILYVLQTIAIVYSISIIKNWDFDSTTTYQYKLEKRLYLIILIIFFTLSINIILLPFFAYTLDSLSLLVPGAMCAAGIISANDYGEPLLILKLIIMFFAAVWLIINNEDLKTIDYKYTKKKILFFVIIFMFATIDMVLNIVYFLNISTESPVLCCSNIYGVSGISSPLPFGLDIGKSLILFYLIYILTVVVSLQKQNILMFISNIFFIYLSYFAVVYFFGTYIYELPTHNCPFCMLQKDYYFVGYVLWGSLFLGVFFGMGSFLLKLITNKELNFTYKYNILFNTIFVLICSLYVILYYIKNGVLL